MTEKRQTIGHPRHARPGPHITLPASFAPLRLRVEPLHAEVEVNCPMATVGRHSDADLRLAFPDISRRHCQFVFENGLWRVYDMHSLNGIYVNNQRVNESTLFSGDHVRIGAATMLVISGTPRRDDRNEKLRQIVDVLPFASH